MHIFFFLTHNYIIIMIFLTPLHLFVKPSSHLFYLWRHISIKLIERIRFFIFNLLRICPSFDEQHFLWWHIPFKKWQIIIKMSSQTKRMYCLRLKKYSILSKYHHLRSGNAFLRKCCNKLILYSVMQWCNSDHGTRITCHANLLQMLKTSITKRPIV